MNAVFAILNLGEAYDTGTIDTAVGGANGSNSYLLCPRPSLVGLLSDISRAQSSTNNGASLK